MRCRATALQRAVVLCCDFGVFGCACVVYALAILFVSIILVVIEMSIFCGVDFFTTRPAESGLEDTEGLERELKFYYSQFWRTN